MLQPGWLPEGSTVRVVAASFDQRKAAEAARSTLMSDLHLEGSAIGIGSLAHRKGTRHDQTVLAAHFHDDLLQAFYDVVAAHGGTVLLNVDERGTRPGPPRGRGIAFANGTGET